MREQIRRFTILLTALLLGGATTGLGRAATPEALALPIRINEVNYEANWVEIFNGNDQSIDVSTFYLCTGAVCQQLGSLIVRAGSTAMPTESFLVVKWDAIRNADGNTRSFDGEVALYVSNPMDDADLLDYVAFGAAQPDGREAAAVVAGLWKAGEAVAQAPTGKSLAYFGGGASPAKNWAVGEPTLGDFNAQVATAVDDADEVVETFRLTAPYPNPFNPGTRFTLTVAQRQHVAVEVYNLLGRRVAVLYDGSLAAQTPQAFTFEAGDLPSGLYLIRVEGEHFADTRRVTLLQ